jgi:excisionase family DNA binding protein
MHRRLQFGMRENPAPDRRHGSRQALPSPSNENLVVAKSPPSQSLTGGTDPALADADGNPNAACPRAATGEKSETIPSNSSQTIRRERFQRHAQSFEPLIGSLDASKLLGNIHVKTLQRYARRGNLPGYQIGGHWYFRASELDSWLRSRLNSSCHPCRLQEESDGT